MSEYLLCDAQPPSKHAHREERRDAEDEEDADVEAEAGELSATHGIAA